MEIFKDIKGYEGMYQVNNLGNIKSLNYGGWGKERMLKPGKNGEGYLHVLLSKTGKVETKRVHKLVGKAFIDNPENKPCINHINGIKTDNRVENLEWNTYSENAQHAWNTGLNKITKNHICYTNNPKPNKGKFGKNHHSSKQVDQFDLGGNFIKTWGGMHEASRELGILQSSISSCCKGRYKTAGGFKWECKS